METFQVGLAHSLRGSTNEALGPPHKRRERVTAECPGSALRDLDCSQWAETEGR